MLNIRSRVFFVVSVIVLFVLAVVIFILVVNKKDENPGGETQNPDNTNQINDQNFDGALLNTKPTEVPAGTKVKTQTTEEMEQNAVIKIAKIFTERYGTYSNHGSYENIKDVLGLSTENFASVLSAKIPSQSSSLDIDGYKGVTTEAIASELIDWQKTLATVLVSAIKKETVEGQTNNVNVKAEVVLKKVDEDWLIDDFSWK